MTVGPLTIGGSYYESMDAEDSVMELSGSRRKRRRRLDPIDLATAEVTDDGKEVEKTSREKFLDTARVVLEDLLRDLTPEQSARRLFQIGEFTEVVREGMRVLGQYDFPEQRRRFRRGEGVSDAETTGAIAMTDGMAAMQASMRTKQIADLSQSITSLTQLRDAQSRSEDKDATTAQIDALQRELNVLVSTIPAGSPAARVRPALATKVMIDAEFEAPPIGTSVTGKHSGRPGIVRDVFAVDGELRLDVRYTDEKIPSHSDAPLDEWVWTNEALSTEQSGDGDRPEDCDGPEEPPAPAPASDLDDLLADFDEHYIP